VIIIDARLLKSILEELAERKLIERAKGLLMKAHGLDEESAYALLRKTAMDRKLKLVEVARELLVHRNSA
jgi:response regulator NasT